MPQEHEVLRSLESDLNKYKKVLNEALQTVQDQDVSNYPILVAFREGINLGLPILEMGPSGANWSYNVSTLEEFVTKGLIERKKVDAFKKVYKNPNKTICLFVCEKEDAHFVFAPM
ncbi:MAG: hypothetical protein AAF502_03720 [Bacteroidota bacterium]